MVWNLVLKIGLEIEINLLEMSNFNVLKIDTSGRWGGVTNDSKPSHHKTNRGFTGCEAL